jgi:hypothetical protein
MFPRGLQGPLLVIITIEWTGVDWSGLELSRALPADDLTMRSLPPFHWLLEKRNRRSTLVAVEKAIRAGWLDDATTEHRAELTKALRRLLRLADLEPRELVRVNQIANAMCEANLTADVEALRGEMSRASAQQPPAP